MGFLDKVKQQASEAIEKGKEKVEEQQNRRRSDDLLSELGAIVYLQHTGRARPDSTSEMDRLVGELQALEASGVSVAGQGGAIAETTAATTAPPPPPPTSTAVPPPPPPSTGDPLASSPPLTQTPPPPEGLLAPDDL